MKTITTITAFQLAVVIAMLVVGKAVCGETGSVVTQKEADDLVAFHNKVRKDVGVAPVKWSNDLAKYAQAWADQIAKTGDVKHRPLDGDFSQQYGENIYWGNGGKGAPSNACPSWYGELKLFKPGDVLPDDMSKFKSGHYTQMVWRSTTQVGAGKAVIKTGQYKGYTVTVCNYDPAGNVVGEKPY